jgi:hypothetical protein
LAREEESWMRLRVEAATANGKPPVQFILGDPKWKRWSKWDIAIANAYHMLAHYEVNGYPVWIDSSPRVSFETKERKSRSQEQLDIWQNKERKRLEKKGAKPKFGVSPYVVPRTLDGGPLPTKQEWVEAQKTGLWKSEMKLSTGEVVQTAADPEQMQEFRAKMRARRSQRRGSGPVD